jgi:drug/metabolite transporter (DMT)-like permease
MTTRPWLIYALVTTAFWGVWGAFTGLPTSYGFPETLIYCVWALTMILPAVYALSRVQWRLQHDAQSVVYGLLIGLLGAGGQMLLFHAVRIGPTYLIFPIISLSPVITIVLSLGLLKERTGKLGALGILFALCSLPLFDYSNASGASGFSQLWFVLALGVLVAWGVQGFFMKLANATMNAESIFFYMMLTGLVLIPVAVAMTDFSVPINWGPRGPWLAAGIQILNAIGALTLVYAFRYGKAIVVSPLTNAGAPLITAILAIVLLGAVPTAPKVAGIALALLAALLLAIEPDKPAA